jgi:hypothetical protein
MAALRDIERSPRYKVIGGRCWHRITTWAEARTRRHIFSTAVRGLGPKTKSYRFRSLDTA